MDSGTPPEITLAYVIAGSRRCGSNLLCDWLRGAGVAGQPGEHIEQLEPREDNGFVDLERFPDVARLLGPNGPLRPLGEDLVAFARARGTGANGVFGTTIFGHNFRALAARLGLPSPEVMRLLTPDGRCIHVTRRRKDAQAVSNWIAMQTGSWLAGHPERREPEYHDGQMRHIERALEQHDAVWLALFEAAGIEPYTVVYEEFAESPEETTRGVLRFLGLPDDGPITPSRMQLQRDRRSADWLARYTRREHAG